MSAVGIAAADPMAVHDAFATAAALNAAERLGVFELLLAGPIDGATVARHCAIGEGDAALLLAALGGLGITASGDGRSHRPAVPVPLLGRIRAMWRSLDETLRTGRPVLAANQPVDAGDFYPEVAPMLAEHYAPAAERTADHLAAPALRVLDLGAGAAPWSLALARRDRDCRVTAFDLPATIGVARRAATAAGCAEQFTFLTGDFLADEWGADDYDLALLGNLCHLFDAATNRDLIGRAHARVRPGGTVAIIDVAASESLPALPSTALYALGLRLRSEAGRLYPFTTYVGWLRDAGFATISRHDLPANPPLHLIAARRPA